MSHLDQKANYVIKIQGCIDGNLVDWYGPVDVAAAPAGADDPAAPDGVVTTLSGIIVDQAGLVGLIRHLHGLGLALLSVERVVPGSASQPAQTGAEE